MSEDKEVGLKARKYRMQVECELCGAKGFLMVNDGDYAKYLKRGPDDDVEVIFPYLKASEIALLVTGDCGKC